MKTFFGNWLILSLLAALLNATPSSSQALFRWPLVGSVSDRSATVLVWCGGAGAIKIEYDDDPTFATPQLTAEVTPQQSEDFVLKVTLPGLRASTRYYYHVLDAAGGRISPNQSFTTFAPPGSDSPVTLLFGSCNRTTLSAAGKTFDVGDTLGGGLLHPFGGVVLS